MDGADGIHELRLLDLAKKIAVLIAMEDKEAEIFFREVLELEVWTYVRQ
jgi:hypothetical protein